MREYYYQKKFFHPQILIYCGMQELKKAQEKTFKNEIYFKRGSYGIN